ncbi:hypothetical protein GCM10011379_06300 [Filimonas zeae]|uniref:RNA polymerase sigma-70 factor, ECF subfamily n=1 Tax=Filimonas zeae TaxID=1737353 RepID=A0A917MRT2_9BACT|nr:hypothetical protein GCM10011379_06300 [Filimonas zeae]
MSTPEQIHIERELFQLTAAGDEAAFERLFYAYAPRLHGLILKITRHEPVVKDIKKAFSEKWSDGAGFYNSIACSYFILFKG